MEHKDLVREEFTRQANDYATAPAIRDAEHLRKLVELVAPPSDARVLELATGRGMSRWRLLPSAAKSSAST